MTGSGPWWAGFDESPEERRHPDRAGAGPDQVRPVVLSAGTGPTDHSRPGWAFSKWRGWLLARLGLVGVLALAVGGFMAAVATWTVVDSVGIRPQDPLWITPPAVEPVRRTSSPTSDPSPTPTESQPTESQPTETSAPESSPTDGADQDDREDDREDDRDEDRSGSNSGSGSGSSGSGSSGSGSSGSGSSGSGSGDDRDEDRSGSNSGSGSGSGDDREDRDDDRDEDRDDD